MKDKDGDVGITLVMMGDCHIISNHSQTPITNTLFVLECVAIVFKVQSHRFYNNHSPTNPNPAVKAFMGSNNFPTIPP